MTLYDCTTPQHELLMLFFGWSITPPGSQVYLHDASAISHQPSIQHVVFL
jgi:hypothetical protein